MPILDYRCWEWLHSDGTKTRPYLEIGDRVRIMSYGTCEVISRLGDVYLLKPVGGEPSPAVRPELAIEYVAAVE